MYDCMSWFMDGPPRPLLSVGRTLIWCLSLNCCLFAPPSGVQPPSRSLYFKSSGASCLRHRRQGAHKTWEDILVAFHGNDWLDKTADFKSWKNPKDDFVNFVLNWMLTSRGAAGLARVSNLLLKSLLSLSKWTWQVMSGFVWRVHNAWCFILHGFTMRTCVSG